MVESDFAMNFGIGAFYCSGELFNEVIKYYSAAVTFYQNPINLQI